MKPLLRPFKLLAQLLDLALLWVRAALMEGRGRRWVGSPQRILVLGYGGIGDIVFLLPTLRALRRAWPQAKVTYVSNRTPATSELIPATGLADEVWTVDAEAWFWLRPRGLLRRLREGRFDLMLCSQAAPLRLFAPALLSIPVRVGNCRPVEAPHEGWSALRYALWRLKRGLISQEFERRVALNRKVWIRGYEEHTVRRNLRLAAALGLAIESEAQERPELPEPPSARAWAEARLPKAQGRLVVGLHIGSPQSQYDKIWPARQWGLACRRLAETRPLSLVLFGGPDEKALAAEFREAYGGDFTDLTGAGGLLEGFAAIKRCGLFLCNDTGLAKAAMALGVRTLTVWGPSDRHGYGLFWEAQRHSEVHRPMPCAPCVRMGLRQEGAGVINFSNCGHHDCLRLMDPAAVAEAAGRMC